MELQKCSINQQMIETVLAWVQTGVIAMKPAGPKALESEIAALLYRLHRLTSEEILVVEGVLH